jgi:HlyD family secretion protein
LALLLAAGIWMTAGAPSGEATVQVLRVTAAAAAPPADVLTGTGYVVTQREYVDVGSTVVGRVAWVGADEGDRVPAGGVLARLDDRELGAAHREAEAALATAEARLAELRAGPRDEEVEEARALLAEAEASLQLAAANHDRAEQLFAAGVIAAQALDTARSAKAVADSRRGAAAQRYALVKQGPRAEEVAIAAADAARARAAAEHAAARLAEAVIRAPFDAVVLEKLRDVGDFVVPGGIDRRGSGSALFRIASTADLRIEVEVSESSVAGLAGGRGASVVLDAAPARTYRARVAKIHPSANRQKATVKVELDVLDADAAMKPEMTAKVEFDRAAPRSADLLSTGLRIPSSAVVETASGSAVFVVDGSAARLQPVALGAAAASEVEIAQGLRDGDLVVTSDPHRLIDGQPVRIAR